MLILGDDDMDLIQTRRDPRALAAEIGWALAACLCLLLLLGWTNRNDAEAKDFEAGRTAGRQQMIDAVSDAYAQGMRDSCTAPDEPHAKARP